MMRVFLKAMIALTIGFVSFGAFAGSDIQIQDPWVQAAPPNVKILAAYMEIRNNGEKPQILTSVASPDFSEVGIHQSVMHGDMVHMEQLKELAIPQRASVVLKPGGLHLMLMDAKKQLRAGDQVPMTLTFKNGEKIAVKAIVRSGQTGGMEDHQHMHHSGHEGHNH